MDPIDPASPPDQVSVIAKIISLPVKNSTRGTIRHMPTLDKNVAICLCGIYLQVAPDFYRTIRCAIPSLPQHRKLQQLICGRPELRDDIALEREAVLPS